MIPQAAFAATSLLRGLLGTSSPQASHAVGKPQSGALQAGDTSFASLLQQARAGAVQSGLPVTFAQNAGVKLTTDQLTRLAASADVAEANGASSAIMAIDGKLLKMDVARREITAEILLSTSDALTSVLTDVDAFVRVPSADGQAGTVASSRASSSQGSALSSLSHGVTKNPSLLSLLAQEPVA